MVIIYTFENEEYEYEVEEEDLDKAIYEWFANFHEISVEKAKEIISEWDLINKLEKELGQNDEFYYDLYQKLEEKAFNEYLCGKDAYSCYGVSRKDFA